MRREMLLRLRQCWQKKRIGIARILEDDETRREKCTALATEIYPADFRSETLLEDRGGQLYSRPP
jgi:hypothetical protein